MQVIFTELIGRVRPSTKDATQTLILVHRRELVEQAARHCSRRYPSKSVEIEMGNSEASGIADITIASVQSINSRDRIDKFDPARFKLILVDEAHHIVAAGYLKILDHFGLQSETTTVKPALVGVSATFSRHDGLALGKAIKHIVFHKDYVDMIGEKWLSDVLFTSVQSGADISKVRKAANGDFATSSLSSAVNQAESNSITVRSWMARAPDRKSTLVFCVDIRHLLDLTAMFRKHGIDARYVTGLTPNAERGSTIQSFKDGEFPVLLNCGVFTEGTDIPNIDCVILARPTRSRNLLVQMIGRGMRLHPGKENCHILDMVATLEDGIVTVPTLFGLDPSELVEQADPNAMREQKQRKEAQKQQELESKLKHLQPGFNSGIDGDLTASGRDVNITFTDYDSVADLIADTSSERHIRALSQNAWICVGESRYVLTNGSSSSHLILEKNSSPSTETNKAISKSLHSSTPQPPSFTVRYFASSRGITVAPTKSPYLRPRTVASGPTFESAVHAADTFAAKHFTRAFIVLHGPPARWRQAEASQAQIDTLNKKCGMQAGEELTTSSLTKGQAMDMLTKLKFGAKGTFKQIQALRARQEKATKKRVDTEKYRAGEGVEVGPLPGVDDEQDEPVGYVDRDLEGENEAELRHLLRDDDSGLAGLGP